MRDPHSGALHGLLEGPLLAAIDELPPEFKMTVMLADIEELSYREIAESMSCPIGTVMSRLHRARRWLRAQLIEHAQALGLIDEQAELLAELPASAAVPSLVSPSLGSSEIELQRTGGGAEVPESETRPIALEEYRQKRKVR